MNDKRAKWGEAAFLAGTAFLSFGTALQQAAGFGMSMVVAPAYVLADWVGFIPAGTMCYLFQGFLILLTSLLLRRFKLSYLFSFFSAVVFGLLVDAFTALLTRWIIEPGLALRLVCFVPGVLANSLGIALLLNSYLPPQAPELLVKELSAHYGWNKYRAKYAYDGASLALSAALSLLLLGQLRFIGVGTFIITAVNGPLISLYGRFLEKRLDFSALLPGLQRLFAGEEEETMKGESL